MIRRRGDFPFCRERVQINMADRRAFSTGFTLWPHAWARMGILRESGSEDLAMPGVVETTAIGLALEKLFGRLPAP